MRIFAFAASLRAGSYNRTLVELAAEIARDHGADVDLAEMVEFDVPLYDEDIERQEGLARGAIDFKRRLELAEGVIIAAPEYNYSISGVLKNLIDWVSRARPMPWRGKSIYLMSASLGPVGGVRGLWATRVPLEGCGALVFPDMFSVPFANEAFDRFGRLTDPEKMMKLRKEVVGFMRLAEAVAPICDKAESVQGKRRQIEIVDALEDESDLQPTVQ